MNPVDELVEASSYSLFAPATLQDIRNRLSFIAASECNCGDGIHENAVHDLIEDDVPVLLRVIEAQAEKIEQLSHSDMGDHVSQLVAWNDEHNVPADIRMLKISEEYGEATDAYLGYLGANPRKGITNGVEAVWTELADTALAALVAIGSLGGDAESELLSRIAFVKARLNLT